jgi:hypothetical protein
MSTQMNYTFTLFRRSNGKPDFMIFLYNVNSDMVIMAWEFDSKEERDKQYLDLRVVPDHSSSVAICKGSMISGRVIMEDCVNG